MTDDLKAIDVESIVSSSQVFAEHSVQELLQLNKRINRDIQTKRQDLRNLVGSKYRDLLSVADNIITMDELVQAQDTNLTKLVFQNSNYTSKPLTNKIQFHSSISKFKKESLISGNLEKVTKSMLDDLEDLSNHVLKLRDDFDKWNKELNDEEETFESAEQLVDISIFIYMIQLLFAKSFETNILLKNRFDSLKEKILSIIKYMLTELVVDGENELVLNLLMSYIIITLQSPLELFQSFLDSRFIKFQKFQLNRFDFQNSLKYLFNTISYINLFKTKLVTMAIRIIHLNNSSNKNSKCWFKLPYVAKWRNWIMNYDTLTEINFPQSITDLRGLTEEKIENTLSNWKLEISEHYVSQISFANNDLSTEVDKITNILIGFKNFTSLVDLKLNNGNLLVFELIQKWEKGYLKIIDLQLSDYNDITKSIILIHSSAQHRDENLITNIFKREEDDLSNIETYLHKISETASNLVGPNKTLLLKIDDFYKNIQAFAYTLVELLKLKLKLLKPVLSIDDAEDDEFWNSTASKIQTIYTSCLSKIQTNFAKIEADFIQQLTVISDAGIEDPSQASDLLRCLIALNNKPKLEDYFQDRENDKNINNIQSSTSYIDSAKSKTYSPLLLKFVRPLLQTLARPSIEELELDIYERFNKASEVEDLIIWDKTSKEKYIPVQPSYSLVVQLYKLSEDILHNNENKDILEIAEISDVKTDLITGVITELIDHLDQKFSTQETTDELQDLKVEDGKKINEIVTSSQATEEGTQTSKNKKKKNKKKKNKDKNLQSDQELNIIKDENKSETTNGVGHLEVSQNEEDAVSGEDVDNKNEEANPSEVKAEELVESSSVINSNEQNSLSEDESTPPIVEHKAESGHDLNDEMFVQKALLTYADLIYLILFLNKKQFYEDLSEELANDVTAIKARKILRLDELYDKTDIGKIHKNVFEFFKSNKSLYIF